jgi:flagellar basal body rod protein FlgB
MAEFLNSFKSLKVTGTLLSLITKNQTVVANNISNLQTPEYVKKNTNFEEVIGSIRSPVLTDLAKEMGPGPTVSEGDGKVVLEEELVNMQKNFLYYSVASRRAASLVTTLKAMAQVGR